ncbi:MAG TPA: phosphoribosylformylglycinamidine cyclo-ligase [Spirochaetota bacterium]|nr:phosphoribosylformylglycinamidine cyclo-ligase [Spirochaetota bacterium]HOM39126.1 phosphoribosylformylglycinamidine cyclo-ligase [Spirochaetota bacterium]HPQ50009.1 phosphoribosylformylglycinamidine cyclo-ligase [Spirochaetota bacterium]
MDYKSSGVDINAGDEFVSEIKRDVESTFNKNVLRSIGLFGSFFQLPEGYKEPVLVSSVDGVGTKLKVAFLMNRHDSVGEDIVNHCVNDIATSGAKPLFFLDYLATGKLEKSIHNQIIKGMAKACRENGVSLVGGETAEMPGFYKDSEYDIAGTIVGVVEKSKIIDGSKIKKGDVLVGLKSTGLHTNGYSLARKVLLGKYTVDTYIKELGQTIGEALLAVHKSYLKQIELLKENIDIKGISHITGGGIEGNTKRLLKENFILSIDWGAWDRPAIFNFIQKEGNIEEEEMRRVFNLGIGIIFIIDRDDLNKVLNILKNEEPLVIGEIK